MRCRELSIQSEVVKIMWKPAERIKYKALDDEWPDAGEAAKSRLFSPIDIGTISLKQRTWIPAMVP